MTGAEAQPSQRAPGDGFLVLWTGASDASERAIIDALRAEGVRVEEVALDGLVDRTNRRAPDLVALAGMAAQAPDAFVQHLGQTQPGAFVPIVTVGPSSAASPKARSRFGLVARLDREEAPEPLATRIATLLRGLSRRPPRWRVRAGLEDLPSLARRTAASGRTGILAAKDGGGIAIDGEHVAPEPGLFVASLTGVIEPDLALHERAPGTLRVLREVPRDEETAPTLEGTRVLVIDDDIERGRAFAARLEKASAQARATGVVSQAVHAGRAIDPTLVVVSAPALVEPAVASLWEDPRLSTSALLVLDGPALEVGAAALLGEVARMTQGERALRRRLERGEAVAERLETVGPTRWLKLLGGCTHDVTLRVFAAAGRGRIDLSEGKIHGASFRPTDPRAAMMEGRPAVEALIALRFGRVLAGPPGDLGKLEGMRRQRKASIVGRIVPTPPSGVRSKRGLIAEEVVVQHTDAASPVKVPRVTVPSPGRRAKDPHAGLVPIEDDDEEVATRTYSAEAVAELHEQLRRSVEDDVEASGESGLLQLDEPPTDLRKTEPGRRRAAAARENIPTIPARKRTSTEAADGASDANGPGAVESPETRRSLAREEPPAVGGSAALGGSAAALGGSAALGETAAVEETAAVRGSAALGGTAAVGETAALGGSAALEGSAAPEERSALGKRAVEETAALGESAALEAPGGLEETAARETSASRKERAKDREARGATNAEAPRGDGPSTPKDASDRAAVDRELGASPDAAVDDAGRARAEGGSWWFAAAIVVAVGVGGYAAWQLGRDAGAGSPEPTASDADARRERGGERQPDLEGPESSTSNGPSAPPPPLGDAPGPAAAEDVATGDMAAGDLATPGAATQPGAPAPTEAADAEDLAVAAAEGASDGDPIAGGPVDQGIAGAPGAAAMDDEAISEGGAGEEGAPAVRPSGERVWDLIERSSEAVRAQDYPRSETLARQALAASPRNGPAAYRLAVALFRQRRIDEAMEWAERAAEWDPEDPLPLSLQGDLHMRVGRFRPAIRAYQRAVEVEPRFGPAQRRLDDLRERGILE